MSHKYTIVLLLVVREDILLDTPTAAISKGGLIVSRSLQYAVSNGLALVFIELGFRKSLAGNGCQEYLVARPFTSIHLVSFDFIAFVCSLLLHLYAKARFIIIASRV